MSETNENTTTPLPQVPSALTSIPPMGVYETLFRFLDVTGKYMGTAGTHPWVQGCPITTTLPNGPVIPTTISLTSNDYKYPSPTGQIELLTAIRNYYNFYYQCNLTTDNICVFAGGRCGIFVTMSLLQEDYQILIEEAEYTPYYDLMINLKKNYQIVPSNIDNKFNPSIETYQNIAKNSEKSFILKSNPCNPTGVTRTSEELRQFAEFSSHVNHGCLFDEAYEFFHESPDSILRYIPDINTTNVFVSSAATKGLQAPGLRIGWIIASKQNIEIFRNYSGIAMGGISRASQVAVTEMLNLERIQLARVAVNEYYAQQRQRYGQALLEMGLELFTGNGGFYHWCRLPSGMNCTQFNERLYLHEAAILPGSLCDMFRRGDTGPFGQFIRFSFGPLYPESFEDDIRILKSCLHNN